MTAVLNYRGYVGSINHSEADAVHHGEIQGIQDLVLYEADGAEGLQAAFEEAVEHYLEGCGIAGEGPNPPSGEELDAQRGGVRRRVRDYAKSGA